MRGVLFIYHLLWSICAFPLAAAACMTRRRRLRQRMGLEIQSVPLEGGSIWVHALSVGEVISAVPLIRSLKDRFPQRGLVLTVTTSKGMEVAQRELAGTADEILTMPLDFWWSIRRISAHIRPAIFLLVETDLWPGLVHHLSGRGIMSILVNGRISPRTFRSYMRFAFFTKMMYGGVSLCLMQSDPDVERLLLSGVERQKIVKIGNIKYDRPWPRMGPEEREGLVRDLGLEGKAPILVAGSTHKGEEQTVLDVFERLRRDLPGLCLIIAPRRIAESQAILSLCMEKGLNARLRKGHREDAPSSSVLILNTIGELGRIYGLASVSFVGGSLVPLGGHNLLEPASLGCPVLFGPYTHNFAVMAEMLEEAQGGVRVQGVEELYGACREMLLDEELRLKRGESARRFVEQNRGALERVMAVIERGLKGNG